MIFEYFQYFRVFRYLELLIIIFISKIRLLQNFEVPFYSIPQFPDFPPPHPQKSYNSSVKAFRPFSFFPQPLVDGEWREKIRGRSANLIRSLHSTCNSIRA